MACCKIKIDACQFIHFIAFFRSFSVNGDVGFRLRCVLCGHFYILECTYLQCVFLAVSIVLLGSLATVGLCECMFVGRLDFGCKFAGL